MARKDLIGKEVYGFKYENQLGISFVKSMEDHIGEIGKIDYVEDYICTIKFKSDKWWYPIKGIEKHFVDRETVEIFKDVNVLLKKITNHGT